ncbi:MAG: hypothetical protein JST42_27510 [Bacteroidetes bacterium]|nr:hypothetical protein [Bacteroidota bacterium]
MKIPLLFSGKWLMVLIAGSIISGCGHKLAPLGHYQDTPVVADGKINDWKQPLRFNYPGYAIQYNITSDDKDLYICVSTADEETQLRMLRAGMTIWFDPKGEKNKTIGLFFPIRKQSEPVPSTIRSNERLDMETRKAELLLQSNYYNTTGFLHIENGQFGLTDTSSPIRLAIKNDEKDSLLVYEVVIPIRNVVGLKWMAKAARNKLSMDLALNAMPAAGGGHYGGGRPSPRGLEFRGIGGGMRRMGGGRRYGGGAGGNAGQKEEDNWYTFRLPLTR